MSVISAVATDHLGACLSVEQKSGLEKPIGNVFHASLPETPEGEA